MLQCNVFPGLPPDFLDSEVNLFLVPFMDSEAESENPPRAGMVESGPQGYQFFPWSGGRYRLPWPGVIGTHTGLRGDSWLVLEVLGPFLRSVFPRCWSTGRAGPGLDVEVLLVFQPRILGAWEKGKAL